MLETFAIEYSQKLLKTQKTRFSQRVGNWCGYGKGTDEALS